MLLEVLRLQELPVVKRAALTGLPRTVVETGKCGRGREGFAKDQG